MSLRWTGIAVAAANLLLLSCAAAGLPGASLVHFSPATAADPWKSKVANWQARNDLDPIRRGVEPSSHTDLAGEYQSFTRELRRRVASDTMAWVQDRARQYYRADGDRDHWATYGEVIEAGRDDCDGLDLLTFELLRRLGFGSEEIYRAILVERASGQHHMVTLWFEDGKQQSDPFVLDPTGVVTHRMVRLSEVPSWQAIELFDERAHYRVEPQGGPGSVAGR